MRLKMHWEGFFRWKIIDQHHGNDRFLIEQETGQNVAQIDKKASFCPNDGRIQADVGCL